MLCNNAREYLLQNNAEGAALVLDLCYRLHQSLITVPALMMLAEEADIEVSVHILRRGILRACELGLLTIAEMRLTRVGRPTKFYRVPSAEQVAEAIGVRVQSADVLPDTAFRSASEYRRALHLAFLKRNSGKQFSREYLGARLGVSKRTTWAYERGVPYVQKTPVYRTTELTFARCRQLPEREIGAVHLIALRQRGRFELEQRVMPLIRSLAFQHLRDGWKVWVRQQAANVYEWIQPEVAHLQGA